MHTRRLAAYLLGAWILGILLMGYVGSQSFATVEKILNNPPGPVAKDIEDLGTDIARMMLRYEASELNRFMAQVWGVIQLGLGAALIITSVLTQHRSRFIIIASTVMVIFVVYQMFVIQPSLNALGRSFDFLPPGAAPRDREAFATQTIWFNTLEVLKVLFGLVLSGRLLFDRYNWKDKLVPQGRHRGDMRRRKHRSSSRSSSSSASAVTVEAREPQVLDPVENQKEERD
jgi:hypothetical protein